jgi:hypothetical protein
VGAAARKSDERTDDFQPNYGASERKFKGLTPTEPIDLLRCEPFRRRNRNNPHGISRTVP